MRLDPVLRDLAPRGFGVTWRADVLIGGEVVDTLPVDSGDVTDEADAQTRRRCNLVVPGLHQYIPSNSKDYLWPVGGAEVALVTNMSFRGGRALSGDIPLGVYRIQKPVATLTNDGDRAITFEGYDRSLTVARAKLRSALTLPKNTSITTILMDVLEPVLPANTVFNFPDDSDDLILNYTLQWDLGDDRWANSVDITRALGYDLFFDAAGVCVLRQITDPIDKVPDFVHTTGDTAEILWSSRDMATVKDAEWSVDDADTYNHIIVKGENTDSYNEVFGEAWDADPLSPTWIGGEDPTDVSFGQSPFGDKLNVISNQAAFDKASATRAANAELIKAVGLTENLSVRTFYLPHESEDIVKFIIPEIEVENTYILDGVHQVLSPEGDLDMATRQRRVTGIAA